MNYWNYSKITSKISIIRIKNAIRMLLMIPGALIYRFFYPDVWIISERPEQARDNGYCFFKYLKKQHPEQEIYYIIDKKSKDYKKIEQYGSIIPYGSWKHCFFYCLSRIHISSHVGGCNIGNNPSARSLKNPLGIKDVFLPHGVSYGVSEFCLAKYAGIDLFITSGKPEYDNVLRNYGYTKDQVAYTGFPRLDEWHDLNVNEKQIVLMPTWRLYLAQNPDTVFEETEYFKSYQELITEKNLTSFLADNNLKLIFYLHHNMRKYIDYFHTECLQIEIVYKDDAYDIQD